jgi:hypothetical protein
MNRLVLIAAFALTAVACGGGSPSTYAAAPSEKCLVGKGLTIDHNVDFVASTALAGSFRVRLPGNEVTVALGRTVDEGNNIDQAYRRFRSLNVGIDDVLRQQQNAVLLWHTHPSDADLAKITGCLKG